MRAHISDRVRAVQILPCAIAVLILLAALGGDSARLALRYERAGVLGGEVWRLVTGHFVHLGWSHSALNVAGLALVWMLCAPALQGWRGLWILLVSIGTIDAGFLLGEPQLQWYVGFSGALHGLFAAGVIASVMAREREAVLLAAMLVGKLAFEHMFGAVPLTAAVAGGPVIESAHLYGALGGLLAQLVATRSRVAQL